MKSDYKTTERDGTDRIRSSAWGVPKVKSASRKNQWRELGERDVWILFVPASAGFRRASRSSGNDGVSDDDDDDDDRHESRHALGETAED